ncbi:MAG: ATP-binding protein [Actinomycetota bacterium]|nr:ATP-binding protein [Actinomycetota bacterium]
MPPAPGHTRRGYPIGLVAIVSVVLVAAAFGLGIWRYEEAQQHGRAAMADRADRLRTEEAAKVFWHERDSMNEYLLTRRPEVLSEIGSLRAEFLQLTAGLAEGDPIQDRQLARLRGANDRLLREFELRRHVEGNIGAQLAAIQSLHPFQEVVLLPLRALEAVNLQREQVALTRAASASGQARIVAFLTAILALGAGLGFAIYASRLVHLFTRQAHALEQTLAEREQAHVALQESEGLLRQSQKMEAVGLLAGGVAHDFNNVLTAITGYNDLARADVRPDQHELLDNIDQVKSAATLAGALTAQLLAFSRKEVVQSRVVEVDALLEELAAMLRPLLGARIELVLDLDASGASVEADPVQLQQVVMNLAINARDAMPDGGRVTIGVAGLEPTDPSGSPPRPPGRYVQIAVSDTGTGMDEETRSRAFDPFFTTKEEGKGTGLGLATVHGIVTQSGGDIQIESEPGEGTTFRICLPRTDAVREEITPRRTPAGSGRHLSSPGRRRPTCRPLSIA